MRVFRQTAGIWGPVTFCGAAIAAARHQPGYSHRTHHISGLAAHGERSAHLMVPGFVALGVSSLVMPAPTPALARLARAAGATTIAAGLVPVSQPRCPQPGRDPAATASDAGHGVASLATFTMWTAMPIIAARQGPRWYRLMSRALGVAGVAGLATAGATTHVDSPHKGTAQRAFLGVVFAWHVLTAIVTRAEPA